MALFCRQEEPRCAVFRTSHRKSAPRVVNGKVQRKNRAALTPTYFNTPQETPVIDRFKPGFGYRHILKKKDVLAFIELLPDWKELSLGLRAVILAPGNGECSGWYRSTGIVAICAWERDLWWLLSRFWFEKEHILQTIGVPCEQTSQGYVCKWTESTIRAYQLLDVFLHELGHHHDRMTTKSQRQCCRGEGYAEEYARRYGDLIWERYLDWFGMP
jgi:hypothetical protein